MLTDVVPIQSRGALLRRIARLYLKPGGRLILSCYRPGSFLLGKPALEAESAAQILRAEGFEPVGEAEVRDLATTKPKVRVAWVNVTG